MQQAPRRPRQPHIHVGDPQLDRTIGALLGKIDVVYAHYFAAPRIDDLLVQQVLAHRQPGLIALEMFQLSFLDVELDHPRSYRGDLVMPRQKRQVFASAQEITRHPIGLLGRLDK